MRNFSITHLALSLLLCITFCISSASALYVIKYERNDPFVQIRHLTEVVEQKMPFECKPNTKLIMTEKKVKQCWDLRKKLMKEFIAESNKIKPETCKLKEGDSPKLIHSPACGVKNKICIMTVVCETKGTYTKTRKQSHLAVCSPEDCNNAVKCAKENKYGQTDYIKKETGPTTVEPDNGKFGEK